MDEGWRGESHVATVLYRRGRLQVSMTNSSLIGTPCVSTERSWTGEMKRMTPRSACLRPGTLSVSALALWPSLVDGLSQICPSSKHSRQSGRPVSVTPGPQEPRDARFIWDQHGDHLSPGSAELNRSPWGLCQHWDRLSVATPAGLALFFCQPWIARSLKLLVFFQLKSNKCLEENNPIWKPVGNWVDRFPDFAKMHRSQILRKLIKLQNAYLTEAEVLKEENLSRLCLHNDKYVLCHSSWPKQMLHVSHDLGVCSGEETDCLSSCLLRRKLLID